MMHLISRSKIIKYPNKSSDIPRYYIHLKTDANVTIIIEIPIDEICTISDTANKKYSIDKIEVESDIHNVAISYINLYKSLGISVNSWEIRVDDSKR